jgi:uncharacterized RDD family membrane protein YckC
VKPLVVHSPEHVAIELVPAGLGRRFAAFALDAALIAGAIGVAERVGFFLPRAVSVMFVTTASFLVLWGYHVAFELLGNGQTPGKRILHLRVVDGRGLPLDAAQSLVRNIIRLVDLMPMGGVGMLAALVDPHRRRLGDHAAHTLVVHEDRPRSPAIAQLATRRFNSLRTPRLRKAVANRIGLEDRELLYALCLRAPHLSERARYELFERVGDHYRSELAIEDPNLSGENIVRGIAAVCARQGEDSA